MWLMADRVGEDFQPVKDASAYLIPLVVFFVMLFGFFFPSLYIGIVVNTFD